jgi:hypothetical protein
LIDLLLQRVHAGVVADVGPAPAAWP